MDKKALAQQLLDGFGKSLTEGALTLDERTSSCSLPCQGSAHETS